MPVQCSRCGTEWPKDPALEVPCSRCGAPVGKRCRRPSQHRVFGGQPHAERDRAAMDAGFLMKCLGRLQIGVGDSAATVESTQLTLPMTAA